MAVSFLDFAPLATKACSIELDSEEQKQLLNQARACLEADLDPNSCNEHGVSLLGYLGGICRGSRPCASALARMLIEHGANPLQYDQPLGKKIKHFYSSSLVNEVLSTLGLRESKGEGLRDPHGGTVLHYLAYEMPELAAGALAEDRYEREDMQDPSGFSFFPLSLVNVTNNKGSTALHVLWEGIDPSRPSLDFSDRWEMAWELVEAGASLHVLNDAGKSPAQMMQGLPLPPMHPDVLEAHHRYAGLRARCQQEALDVETPGSAGIATRRRM